MSKHKHHFSLLLVMVIWNVCACF
ncbi:hypothetical protein LEMLEM_LOCUS18018 [Lemmus lemmus]